MLLYPYNPGSQSSKALAQALDIKRIKHEGGVIKSDVILNWGASKIERPIKEGAIILNSPDAVATASNKLEAFKKLQGKVSIPEYTEDKGVVKEWLKDGRTVFARTKLNAHSGEGIVVCTPEMQEEIPEAKLYTRYIPKSTEYRLHVFKDRVFFIQKKARKQEVPDEKVNWKIRNHQNGFIYAHNDIELEDPASAGKQAIGAVKALGLDFGAVDLIYNTKKGFYYVLEVNTAPGLQGATLVAYAEVFSDF